MTAIRRLLVAAAGLFGLAGVAASAASAHAVADLRLSTAADFLLLHAAALAAVAALGAATGKPRAIADFAGIGLMLGTLVFCGDLVARALLGGGIFPMAAPAGGFMLMAGWAVLAASAFERVRRQ
ncbi:MAG TPA: DUF423 domain-containing protein [Xanthobacteraceae bacterium]|nr:DUF423 domain-containing protein [Xanthobacteraceae bacterium]